MKNGGWLDAYDDVPQAENGIEGTMGGLTDKGFNYNGAWGGTMQDGGLTFLEPTSRKLPKGYVIPYNTPSTELAISVGGENGEPAYLIPSFKYGRYLTDKDAKAEFRKTGEHLGGPFKTWQEADEWERTVRHPYVEKGQNIPTPLRRWGKDFAMGGSMPGAVGFTYARTGSIPSNGPYAKKTKASAQDGRAISDNTRLKPIVTEKPMNRETISSSNDSYVMSPQEALLNKLKGVRLKESQDKLSKTLEKVTAVGSLSPNPFISVPSGIVNFTLGVTDAPTPGDAGLDYMGLLGSVATPSSLRGFKKIGNRIPFFKGLSFIDAGSDIFEFTPSEDLPKKQNGGEMKYYQEGLDFKPKTISQDGLRQLLTQPPKGDIESYYPELKRIKEAPKVAETKKAAADRANLERVKSKATYVKPGPSETQSRINRQQATELAKQEALQNSPLSQTLGSFTPSGYNPGAGAVGAEAFVNMAPGISIIPSSVRLGQLYEGNDPYGFNQENIISSENALASLGALGDVANVALPIKLGAKATGRFLTEETPLKNAYKINPLAFKANPEAYYRMLGNKGYDDALESGIIRPPARSFHTEAYYNKGYPLDTRLRDLTGRAGYEGPYMAEVKGMPESFVNENVANYTGPMFDDPVVYSKEPISISNPNVKFYKEDWLRGYKEVPKYVSSPVQNIFSKRFERLDNEMRFLSLPELNNPNATKVLENFRERIKTPEGQKRLKDLGITNTKVLDDLTIVGDENTLGQYWMNKIGLNPNLPEVKRVTRHEIEHAVQDAIESSRMNKYKQDADNLKYLFRPKAKKKAIEAAMKPTSEIDDMLGGLELRKTPEKVDWDKIKETRGKREPSELFNYMSDKQRATNYFDSGSGGREKSAFLSEVQQYMMDEGIIPKTSYAEVTPEMVKETFINAMFDEKGGKYLRLFNIMKPNEANYKLVSNALNKMLTVVPVVGGAAAATSQLEQKEKGGKIKKDDMGYWNPDNWGEPVEIDSNEITMEGVYEPLLGISDTGDVQMMYPGEDYIFDGETVTEYPVAKFGKDVPKAQPGLSTKKLSAEEKLAVYQKGQEMVKDAQSMGRKDWENKYKDVLSDQAKLDVLGGFSAYKDFKNNEGLYDSRINSVKSTINRKAVNQQLSEKAMGASSYIKDYLNNYSSLDEIKKNAATTYGYTPEQEIDPVKFVSNKMADEARYRIKINKGFPLYQDPTSKMTCINGVCTIAADQGVDFSALPQNEGSGVRQDAQGRWIPQYNPTFSKNYQKAGYRLLDVNETPAEGDIVQYYNKNTPIHAELVLSANDKKINTFNNYDLTGGGSGFYTRNFDPSQEPYNAEKWTDTRYYRLTPEAAEKAAMKNPAYTNLLEGKTKFESSEENKKFQDLNKSIQNVDASILGEDAGLFNEIVSGARGKYAKDKPGLFKSLSGKSKNPELLERIINQAYKNGGQLIKLDQLTNFTNYNKPTKGGWLDKYK
jgi:hypothetical protein